MAGPYPNDQGQGAGAIPVYLTSGGTPYAAGAPPPFNPTGQATITAGVATSRVALPNTDATLLIQNTGAVTAYVKLGSGTVTAALTDQPILAGQSFALAVGTATNLAAITGSSTAALLLSQGTGTPTLTGAGGSGGGGGGAVTIADGANVTQGAVADAAITNSASSGTLVAFTKGIVARLTTLIALLPSSIGAKTAAGSLGVTTATDDVTLALYGAVNETAPATDTASSGQNGRLQRIAQRLTSFIALFPSSIGAKTGAGSLSVVAATDGLIVTQIPAATSALTNVAASATSVTVLASNVARLGATIFNDSTIPLLLKFGTTASATSCTVSVPAAGYYEVPFKYTGRIDGIWASATGNARVTEVTA